MRMKKRYADVIIPMLREDIRAILTNEGKTATDEEIDAALNEVRAQHKIAAEIYYATLFAFDIVNA